MTETGPGIQVVPANDASWEDLQSVFGTRGQASRCQCQRYKLRPRESFGSFPVEERPTGCGSRPTAAIAGRAGPAASLRTSTASPSAGARWSMPASAAHVPWRPTPSSRRT